MAAFRAAHGATFHPNGAVGDDVARRAGRAGDDHITGDPRRVMNWQQGVLNVGRGPQWLFSPAKRRYRAEYMLYAPSFSAHTQPAS